METLLCKHWHHCRSEAVADFLDTDPERGLSVFEVRHRQEKFGPNTVTVKKRTGPLLRFLKQFHQPLVYILLAAGGITHSFGNGSIPRSSWGLSWSMPSSATSRRTRRSGPSSP